MSRRSLLFMPGNHPGMLINADVLGADMVVFDLEDAVSLDEKDAARILVRNALKTLTFKHSEVGVRINPMDSPYWKEDLATIVPAQPDCLIIPKASRESVTILEKEIETLCQKENIPVIETILLIESAMGILDIQDICEASRFFTGLILGAEDFSSDMAIARSKDNHEIFYARSVLATAARAFKVDAIDTPYTDVEDFEGLVKDTALAKSLGLNGRLLINPRQVTYVHDILSPTEREIQEASAIVSLAQKAKEEGLGVFSFKGKMVDLPVIKRAESTLANAKNWGLIK